ncbi:MAG: DUF4339 domain-containing protein, partial [Deltaproteobacteria bacterium]|nr:DUF4339 domain-containing protein [Deltaproteobacteria bacterium]
MFGKLRAENGFNKYFKIIFIPLILLQTGLVAAQTVQPMWDLNEGGTVFGPFPKDEINKLISSGTITRNTQVRVVGAEEWMNAADAFGFPETEAEISRKERQKRISALDVGWYITNEGKPFGPFKRAELSQMFKDGTIDRKTEIRHESWKNWVYAENIFDFSGVPASKDGGDIQEDTWYISDMGKTFGPFKKDDIRQMIKDGNVNRQTPVRESERHAWKSAETVFDFHDLPDDQWMVWENDLVTGPYSEKVLKAKINKGEFSKGALCQKNGSQKWIPIAAIIQQQRKKAEHKALLASSAQARSQTSMARSQTEFSTSAEANLVILAKQVKSANVVAVLGMLGSLGGVAVQIRGIEKEDETTLYLGMGISLSFAILRLSGVLVSGVAATRYAKKVSDKRFGWGLFAGGLVMGAAGVMMGDISALSDTPNKNVIVVSFVVGQAMMDLFWIAHCVRAKSITQF